MVRKIFNFLLILIIFLSGGTSLLNYFFVKNLGRDVWLSGFKNKGNVNLGPYHAFFASSADNLVLYQPQNQTHKNDINSANFYGNLASYAFANQPQAKLGLWNHDRQRTQIIFTNQKPINSLTVKVSSKEILDLEDSWLNVDYGWTDFVYASYNHRSSYNLRAVHETLLVPDKLTSQKEINNLGPQKANSLAICVRTTKIPPEWYLQKKPPQIIFQFFADQLIVSEVILELIFKNYDLEPLQDWGSVFIFSHFSRTARYLANGQLPVGKIKDFTDPLEFIQALWPYLVPEYRYLSQVLKQPFFISGISPAINPDDQEHYYWTTESLDLSLLEWELYGDPQKPETLKLEASPRSLLAFSWYLKQMYQIGMRKFFMQGVQARWSWGSKSLYVRNYLQNVPPQQQGQYVAVALGSNPLGYRPNKNNWAENGLLYLDRLLTFLALKIQAYRQEIPEMEFVIYIDEKPTVILKDTFKLIKNWNLKHPTFLHYEFSFCDWERDVDYSEPILWEAKYVWIYFLDFYNQSNRKFMEFVQRRRANGYDTGQYSLDADLTFNLVRADPGINSYLVLALAKETQGAPLFMKYALNAWDPKKALWSSDYDEPEEYRNLSKILYASGDTLLAYPSWKAGAFLKTDSLPKKEIESANFQPSARLEALIDGLILARKIEHLTNLGLLDAISKKTLWANIDPRLAYSAHFSNEKFNLHFVKTTLQSELCKIPVFISQIRRFLFRKKTHLDEITAFKVIQNYINFFF